MKITSFKMWTSCHLHFQHNILIIWIVSNITKFKFEVNNVSMDPESVGNLLKYMHIVKQAIYIQYFISYLIWNSFESWSFIKMKNAMLHTF